MPLSHNILILRVAADQEPSLEVNGPEPQGRRKLRRTRLALRFRLLVGLLRFMGYEFQPLGAALESSSARLAVLTFDNPGPKFIEREAKVLNRLNIPATVLVTTALAPLNWAELRGLLRKKWEVGTLGHELTHLTEKSYVEQHRLISLAKQALCANLGAPPTVFAYPFGAYDATTVSCLREEGFTSALTLQRGLNLSGSGAEAFHLRRIALSGALIRDLWLVFRTILSPSPVVATPAIRAATGRESIASRHVGAIS